MAADGGALEADVKRRMFLEIGSRSDVRLHNRVVGVFRQLGSDAVVSVGAHGEPDLGGVLKVNFGGGLVLGVALGIETKRERGGKQRAEQATYQMMLERMGGLYILSRDPSHAHREIDRFKLRLLDTFKKLSESSPT